MTKNNKIDLSKMNILKPPKRFIKEKEVRVTRNEHIKLNPILYDCLKEGEQPLFIKFYYSDDLKTIAIQKGDESDLKFPKTRELKHSDYAKKVALEGYNIPAIYKMSWDPEVQARVGVLKEISKAPDFQGSLKKTKRRK